jgi:hypothetical protein
MDRRTSRLVMTAGLVGIIVVVAIVYFFSAYPG